MGRCSVAALAVFGIFCFFAIVDNFNRGADYSRRRAFANAAAEL